MFALTRVVIQKGNAKLKSILAHPTFVDHL